MQTNEGRKISAGEGRLKVFKFDDLTGPFAELHLPSFMFHLYSVSGGHLCLVRRAYEFTPHSRIRTFSVQACPSSKTWHMGQSTVQEQKNAFSAPDG